MEGLGSKEEKKHTICFVCDFFYPNFGGVENHIYYLAKGLQNRGHKVIVMTHTYENHSGLCFIGEDGVISSASPSYSCSESEKDCVKGQKRYSERKTPALPVYYLPKLVVYQQATMPSLYRIFGTVRSILIKEQVTIMHGHQSTSTMAHECVFIARTLGIKAVFTEHSLFGYKDLFSFDRIINKFLQVTLSDVDHVVCVSNSCRENLLSRVGKTNCPEFRHSAFLSTIPNAIDGLKFRPDYTRKHPGKPKINIILMSRLVYRKGIDLAVLLIPRVCQQFEHAHFLIGGDGPKLQLIQQMVREHNLADRVELLGPVRHEQVRDLLVRGHIFLNCSYTESFCMSLVEAAACGLHVVSTNVGGVPEVLPSAMMKLADPTVEDLELALCEVYQRVQVVQSSDAQMAKHGSDMQERHRQISALHSWEDVTDKTIAVYDRISELPVRGLWSRIQRYVRSGLIAGPLACLLALSLDLYCRVFHGSSNI
jgi:phosphatidylinositol glycan class A protein